MANYTGNPTIFTPNCSSFLDNDLNWDLPNPFIIPPLNPSSLLHNSTLDFQNLMAFSNNNDQILSENQTHNLHTILLGNLFEPKTITSNAKDQGLSVPSQEVEPSIVSSRNVNENSIITTTNKRKAEDLAESSSSLYSSSLNSKNQVSTKQSSSKGKRSNKRNEKVEGNQKEVVHVRARRGQATDSHSIAERIRRGKINEKLKHLQDIVPGCYKTMGMAVMLDEIINYVQSLQNQVEFLSMKLTAASQYYDFNAENEPMEKKLKIEVCDSDEAQGVERIQNRGYDQLALDNIYQSGWTF